ncbi:MAG: sulfotransferase domain-containing protein [Cyanobacteria bacterium J06592_8]
MNNNFVLIIGAMKCGTTSLFHYLAEHPQIAPAKDKEPHFFSYERNFKKGMSQYKSLWNWQPEHTIAMEASTTYTMHPKYLNVAERIAGVEDANFRFIYMMRHPFARIESHIVHLLSGGHQKTPEVMEEHLVFSEYARQLDIYVRLFGRDLIHLLLLEDLKRNPEIELRKICQFLEIDSNYQFQKLDLVMNSQKTLNLHPALRQIYEIPIIKSAGKLISPEIRQKLYKPLSRKKSYKVQLSEADKIKIIKRLQPDLIRLKTEYNIDVDKKWNL